MNQITYKTRCKNNSSMKKIMNIILLGTSGVGKSTFVSSFANYVAYESLDNIHDRSSIKVPIPCSFDICDDEGKLHNFKVGDNLNRDGNESMLSTSSGTQGCKSHEFDLQDLQINLIDTPGIVDTGGIEKDKKNIEAILDFISTLNSLDAICILLKPNEERLGPVFRYSIFELLCQLDKSAAQNICFVFTNSRGTSYRPGGTAKAIKELIDEIYLKKPDLELKFSKANYFCFDSESFRFLIARDTIEFEDDEKLMFKQSWDKSRKECVRMINYISGLPQHNVQNMISINKARRMIEILLKPLVDIAEDIMENQQMCQNHKQDIKAADGDINKLKSQLYVPRTKVAMEYYNYPRLVCNSKNCTESIRDDYDTQKKTHYKKVCYQMDDTLNAGSQQTFFQLGAAGMIALAQNGFGALEVTALATPVLAVGVAAATVLGVVALGATYYYYTMTKCSSCSCLMSEHFLSFYETRKIIEKIKDVETLAKMETEESCLVVAEAALKNLEQELEELRKENSIIETASCTFALFLECRAITLYNDATEDYLNYMIEFNRHDLRLSPQDRAAKQMRLEIQKKRYQEQKEAIKKGCEGSEALNANELLPEDIDLIVTQLCRLNRYGHIFREALEKIEQMKRRDNRICVVRHNVSDSCLSSLFGR